MIREDLVNSAVSFLQDPSVANSPLDKRIAFLQSKNLTQEEVDISLARAGDGSYAAPVTQAQGANYAYRPPPPPGYGPAGYWPQPPQEAPRRDWRDWFIMATVLSGVSYGLYFTAKRYIYPLIAPPTPPQLEQDKASVDEAFNRAFALLDQLNTDTTALKASEEARTQRLDTALADMEGVITSLKDSSRKRDEDSRRIEDDVRGLRNLIPKALESHKETTSAQLKDLGNELKSLKTLVANRMSAGTAPATTPRPVATTTHNQPGIPGISGSSTGIPPSPAPVAPATAATTSNGVNNASSEGAPAAAAASDKPQSPYGRFTNGRAAIPAWQMAAAKKNDEKKDTAESGTVTETTPGS
ncbi:hypothetical protein EJ05DRAFT_473529 [Pseudovirgaria hyperparasitica]|uniref:Peroxisomal membrane protein PEX14 n=1 Tax=Pseudovirgaria hyperparasitica TaxID=470096 RepID=A0A6A6WH33_9PEZI|nr:uncharacterized protein EJ05DRAFT_473529 [Pseudovirgaria hyperparasitica]KAF2760957.1 hypothetical protein EJ05DRAFT_473529 [Pseudovirgaria hyperparasitica]